MLLVLAAAPLPLFATPPTVSITAPTTGSAFIAPASLTLQASASSGADSITKVDFYQGATLVGTATSAPYQYAWSGVAAGSYSLTAVATDSLGATTTSSAVAVTVTPNAPPTVALSAPANNALIAPGASVTFTASATDSDGTITKVEFLRTDVPTTLGEVTTATTPPSTYSLTLAAGLASGTYTVQVRATDNGGATTLSSAVIFVVNAAPVANSKNVAVLLNTPKPITLSGFDQENSALTYTRTASPQHGTLSGTEPNLVYTPAAGYTGPDSFTYKVNDGVSDSAVATVNLTVSTVSFSELAFLYDGTPHAAGVTTSPSGLSVSLTYNGSATAPTAPGAYTVVATVTDATYGGTASDTLAIITTGLIRHAPTLNARFDGSLQVVLPESITLPTTARLSGDLLVPGLPAVTQTGTPTYAGTINGTGADTPTSHTITLDGSAAVRHVVRRTDAVTMPTVTAPPASLGTRNVALTAASQSAGDFATVRNLTLSGSAGAVAVPPGTYGAFNLTGNSTLVLGVAGATDPAVYHLQSLALNLLPGAARIQVVGPVMLTIASGANFNGNVGDSAHPEWLTVRVANSGFTASGNVVTHGSVVAPNGPITLNGAAVLHGTVVADRLVLNATSTLNQPPTVALTAPVAGATASAPATIALQATASDVDGSIALVEFFNGSTKLGQATTAPYQFNWTGVAAGNYTLTAVATDNAGGMRTSSAVNVAVVAAPTVALTAPTAGSTFTAPASVTLQATATAGTGTIAKVEFFQGTTLLGTATSAPYQLAWSNVAVGSYALTAVATDSGGASATSAAVSIVVAAANQAPAAALTSPADGTSLTSPASPTLVASATDADGTVAKVEFFKDGVKVGEKTAPDVVGGSAYSFTLTSPLAAGNYVFTARATDNLGAATTSSTSTVTVNANTPPTVALSAPATNALIAPGAAITFTASATDSDGAIVKVEFFRTDVSTALGEVTTPTTAPSTYTFTLTVGLPSGSYTVQARATDNGGATMTSSSVAIVVNAAPVADPKTLAVTKDIPKAITLTGSDLESNPLTFARVTVPQHGTLSGTEPNLTYTPATGYVGADSFTYKANDGTSDSLPAMVSITVAPPANLPPVISSVAVNSFEFSPHPAPVTVPATIRDFHRSPPDAHPDFMVRSLSSVFVSGGIPQKFLSADRKPAYSGSGTVDYVTSPQTFSEWFRDIPGINLSQSFDLVFTETAPGSGIYGYHADTFFPIDGQLRGNEGDAHNYGFTMEAHTRFVYRPGATITVSSDDDSWVFVNDRLVTDLGGIHPPVPATQTLDMLGMEPGKEYLIDIFYAERGGSGATFHLECNFSPQGRETYTYAVQASDSEGGALTYALTQAPAGMTIDAQTGVITWIVDRGNLGSHPVTVRVSDAGGLAATQTYSLNVFSNQPPTLTFPSRYLAGTVATPVGLAVTVTDDGNPAGGSVTTQWTTLSGPGTVNIVNPGAANTTATFDAAGLYTLQFTAADGSLTSKSTVLVRIDAPASVQRDSDLVAWWPGNQTPEDIIGGKRAQLYFDPTYAAGKVADAFSFDGVDDLARVQAHPDLNVGNGAAGFTFEFWMRAESDQSVGTVFGWRSGGENLGVSGAMDNYLGSHRFAINLQPVVGTYVTVIAENMWATNQWSHIAVTYDRVNGVVRLYRDGALKLEQVVGNLDLQTSYDFCWGCLSGINGSFFHGRLDELALYRRPLSSSDIYAVYAAGTLGRAAPDTNQVPSVNAGPDIFARGIGSPISLAGLISDDGKPAGSPLKIQWAALSGPGSVSFTPANSGATSATFSSSGIYVLQLSASDGAFQSTDTVEVRIGTASSTTPRAPGLVAWWPGDDTAAEVVSGLTTNWVNGPAYVAGKVSDAFAFDGQRRVQALASPLMDAGAWQGLSLEFWARPSTTSNFGTATIFQWRNPVGNTGVSVVTGYSSSGWRLVVDLKDTSGQSHSFFADLGALPDAWQHFAFTYDKATGRAKLYRSGAQIFDVALGSLTPQIGYDLFWGNVGDNVFVGGLDEVALYNRALSSEEIYQDFAADSSGKLPVGSNTAPVVDAGPDRIAGGTADVVPLSGTVTDDGLPAGTGLQTTWSKLSGPGTVNFSNASVAATSATFSQPGVYVLKLSADDAASVTSDTVEIRVGTLYEATPATASLAAWWPGNGNALDVVGGAHGTWSGGPAYSAGQVAQGFSPSGSNYVRIPAKASLDATAWTGLTVDFWVKPDSDGPVNVPMIEWRDANGAVVYLGYSISFGVRFLNFNMLDANGVPQIVLPGVPMDVDVWQHFAVTYDRASGVARVYRDGRLSSVRPLGSFTPRINNDLFIGGTGGFKGVLDEIAVYNRALSASEISATFAGGANGRVPASGNHAPVVNAGPDRIVRAVATPLVLQGTVSDDGLPAGLSLRKQWSVVSGPGTPVFATPTSETTSVTFPTPGIYVLNLAADDGLVRSSDSVEVRVASSGDLPVPADIALWWPLTGSPAEVVRGGHDLQLTRGVNYAAGQVGSGLNFDGAGGLGLVPAHADLNLGASSAGFSIELWIKPDLARDQSLVSWHSGGAEGTSFRLTGNGTRLYALLTNPLGNGLEFSTPGIVTMGAWQHVAVTYDRPSGQIRFYHNGAIAASATGGSFAAQTTYDVYIGGRPFDAATFAGSLDEIAAYSRPLTPTAIAAIYQAGAIGKCPDVLNATPVVNAGSDVAVTSPAVVATLAGSVIDDGRPGLPVVQWTKVDGPAGFSFGDATLASTTATFTNPGLYTLRLDADDGYLHASDVVDVRVGLPAPSTLPTGLIAWWRGNGNTLESVKGVDNAQLLNGAALVPGFSGSAFSFDGVNGQVKVAAYADLDIGASASGFTVELWVNPTVLTDSPLVQWHNGTTDGLRLWSDSSGGKLTGNLVGSGGGTVDAPALQAGVWQHVALVYDKTSGVAQIYVNGVSKGSSIIGTGYRARTEYDLYFGRNPLIPYFFNGLLDEISLYNRPLSGAELVAIYQAGAAGKAPVPVNQPPVVNAGADRTASINLPITLTATATDDGLPTPPAALTYQWTKISGPGSVSVTAPTALTTNATFTAAGDYVLRLTASDSLLTGYDEVAITVTASQAILPSIAIFEPAQGTTLGVNSYFEIAATAADSDGAIAKVEFFQGSTKLGEQTLPEAGHPTTYFWPMTGGLPAGSYTFTAKATDNSGAVATSAPVSITVAVIPSNDNLVYLATPEDSARVSAPVAVTGLIVPTGLTSWQLQSRLRPAGDDTSTSLEPWTTLASGSTPVGTAATASADAVPGVIGTFDPTLLLNGLHELRLFVTTSTTLTTTTPITLVVDGNMKVGAFTVAFEDLKVPVAGVPITLTRTYDSRDPRVGDFGPGWRLALANVRVQKNRNLGTGWYQTPQSGVGLQFYNVDPVGDRIVTVVMPDGESHRFKLGAYVKNRFGDPDDASFATVVTQGQVRFYPLGDTTSKLEPLDGSNQLADHFFIGGTGDQDITTEDSHSNPGADAYNVSRFRLTTKDGAVFLLDEALGLLSMTDLSGNTLVLNRDGANRVTTVVSTLNAPGGAVTTSVTIHRDATGRVDYIRDPANRELDYLYDTSGRLASFTNRELNVTQYRYENTSFPYYLTKIIDPRGVTALRSEYDPTSGRLIKQIDADGKETLFNRGTDATGRFEKIKDRLGNESTFYYDDRGNVTLKIDPLSAQTSFSYYPDSDRVKLETDHYGNIRSMAYDAAGNVLVQTTGAGAAEDPANPTTGYVTRTTYNARSAPTQMTDPAGRVQTFTYASATNNLLTHTIGVGGPAPATTTYTYYTDGTLDTITDALGNATKHVYDYAYSDAAYPGAVKQTTVTVTDPAGAAGSDPANATATVLRTTRTLVDRQENTVAQIATRHLPDGTSEDVVTRSLYDAENRVVATVSPDGRVSETRYTAFGKEDKTVLWKSFADYQAHNDANARVTSYGYDNRGNQTSVTHADGTTEVTGLDLEDRKIWSQDARGHRTFFVYDAAGRQRFTIAPDANDGIGAAAPTAATDSRLADNPRTETVYDLAGRVTDTYDALGHRTQTVYFLDGTVDAGRRQQSVQVLTAGNLTTTYAYDAVGSLRFVTDPRGNTVETRYDAHGRAISTHLPATDENAATQTTTTYDVAGRRVATTDQENRVTRFRYDGLGRLTEVRQYLDQSLAAGDADFHLATTTTGVVSTRYTYDEVGNQQTQTDALGRVTTFWTDVLGRRTQRILPKDAAESSYLTETLQYDGWGNLWKRTDFAGKTTTFAYDTLNRLTSKTADATHPSLVYSHAIARIEYDYDAKGARSAARTFNLGNTPLYSESTPHDERGRLDYKDTVGGRLDYSYHANNLLKDTVSSNSGGVNIGYRYDDANRLAYVDDTTTGLPTRTTSYTYNANGSLATVTQPNTVVHAYAYDTLNRLRTLGVTRGATTLHAYEYKLNPRGYRQQAIENTTRTTTYTYDALYRLTDETTAGDTHTNNGSIGYTLDKVGNRQSRVSQPSILNSQSSLTYNARDWLAGDTYTANGSTVTSTQVSTLTPQLAGHTDTYDFEEHLILRTKNDGTSINVSYDADGHRIAKNILSATAQPVSLTSWLVDTNNLTGYAQVLEERVSGSTPSSTLRVFTYGSSLISQATTVDTQPTTLSYFTTDGHGNVRELTDATGSVTDRYDYDAFGNLVYKSGTTPNAYLYCGEQFDGDLGLYYLRARYLNPDSARFWSQDSYEGSSDEPLSLHKYLYAQADPVRFIDPSGHDATLGSLNIAQAVRYVLITAIAVVAIQRFTGAIQGEGQGVLGEALAGAAAAAGRNWLIANFESVRDQLKKAAKAALGAAVVLSRKPKFVPVSLSITPNIAAHVAIYQGGIPQLLTRVGKAQRDRNRAAAIGKRGPAGFMKSWDEYPFASTQQGGVGASVVAVPAPENWAQGGIIGAAYAIEDIKIGDSFWAVVIP